MTDERDKTVGLKKDVWKALKEYALANDCTLSEAVAQLLKKVEKKDDGTARKPDGGS